MSTNPYAQAAAPAVTAASPEEQQKLDYELAMGSNADYYLPKFQRFDEGGSKVGWHWPAFFVTSWWFIYRKMFGLGILNVCIPLFTLIVVAIVVGAAKPPRMVAAAIAILLFLAPSFLFSMFANSIYWRHIRKAIGRIPRSIANQPDKRAAWIQRNGGTGIGPMIGIMAGVLIFGGGIVAGISIPAYQDYTIRSQVTEGLNLAKSAQARVEEIWISEHRWAEQDDIPGEIPSGRYVEKVEVFTGSIVITFGGQANRNIHGQRMAITPAANQDGDIRWICGNAPTPRGWKPSEGYLGSDVPDKYLPVRCRSGS